MHANALPAAALARVFRQYPGGLRLRLAHDFIASDQRLLDIGCKSALGRALGVRAAMAAG